MTDTYYDFVTTRHIKITLKRRLSGDVTVHINNDYVTKHFQFIPL